jgi:hypothetical protein
VVAALVVVWLLVNVVLLVRGDVVLLGIDMHLHLSRGAEFAEEVLGGRGLVRAMGNPRLLPHGPPLLYLLTIPSVALFGLSHGAMLLPLLPMMLGVLLLTARMAERLWGRWHGPAAVLLLLSATIFWNYSRSYTLEVPLLLAVTWALQVLLEWPSRPGWWRVAGWGLLLAAGLWSKITFPLYLFGPLAVLLLWGVRGEWGGNAGSRGVRGLLPFALSWMLALLLAAPWYLPRLGGLLERAHRLLGAYSAEQGAGSFRTLFGEFFLWELLQHVGPLLLVCGGIGVFWALLPAWGRGEQARSRQLAAAAFLVPAAAFSLHPTDYSRFLLPVLPALAVCGAPVLTGLVRRRRVAALAGVILAVPAAMMLGLQLPPDPGYGGGLERARGLLGELVGAGGEIWIVEAWETRSTPYIADTIDYWLRLLEPRVRRLELDLCANPPHQYRALLDQAERIQGICFLTQDPERGFPRPLDCLDPLYPLAEERRFAPRTPTPLAARVLEMLRRRFVQIGELELQADPPLRLILFARRDGPEKTPVSGPAASAGDALP